MEPLKTGMAELIGLLGTPDRLQRMITDHQPDRLGRCRMCAAGGNSSLRSAWPCTLHQLATRATQGAAPGAGPPAADAGPHSPPGRS
jgi:hypothetical protein